MMSTILTTYMEYLFKMILKVLTLLYTVLMDRLVNVMDGVKSGV